MTMIFSIILAIISIIGILFNAYIILIIILTKQIKTANNILLLHLGIINILIGLLFAIFSILGIKGTEWQGMPCITNGFFFTLLNPLILWTICGLNCDRYYAIAAPLHYTHIVSTKKVIIGLLIGWIDSFFLTIPPLFNVSPYSYKYGLGLCVPDFTSEHNLSIWYGTVFIAITLLLPTTVLICCNAKILIIARYHRHRIASAIFEVTLSAQVTITHQRNPFFVPTVTAPTSTSSATSSSTVAAAAGGGSKFRSSPNAILSVVLLVSSFLIMYVPYYILITSEITMRPLLNQEHHEQVVPFYFIVGVLLILSPAINGYLYGLKNRNLRKAFTNYWRKKQTKNEVNHEIQARTPSTCGSRRPSLTPFGLFTKNNSNLQRRMSETFFDINKSLKNKSKMKRITSDSIWRPSSASSLNLSPKDEQAPKLLKQTISCNTLQVPDDTINGIISTAEENEMRIEFEEQNENEIIDESPPITSTKLCSPATLLQKLFRFEQEKRLKKNDESYEINSTKRSPKILITRAFSEESSEKSSQNNSPNRIVEINRKHSTSASNLLEGKWRQQIKYQDDDYQKNCTKSKSNKFLMLEQKINHSFDESSSSVTSESSSGKIFMNLDDNQPKSIEASLEETSDSNEEQLLLNNSLITHKRYNKPEDARRPLTTSKSASLLKLNLTTIVSTKEIIL